MKKAHFPLTPNNRFFHIKFPILSASIQRRSYSDRGIVCQTSEAEDDVGADLGIDVLHVELAEALAVHGPRAEVAHHHSL